MKPSAMNAIISSKPPDADLASWIGGELARIQSVDRRVIYNRTERDRAIRDFETAVEQLDQEMRKVQAGCPHYSVTRQPDPAGGSDPCNQCDHCGKEW